MKAHASRAEGASRLNSSDHLRVGKTGTGATTSRPTPGWRSKFREGLPEAHGGPWARLECGRGHAWRRPIVLPAWDGPRIAVYPRGLTNDLFAVLSEPTARRPRDGAYLRVVVGGASTRNGVSRVRAIARPAPGPDAAAVALGCVADTI